jgi:hypothetical protein
MWIQASANLAYIKGCWFLLDLFLVILCCSPWNLVIVRDSRILHNIPTWCTRVPLIDVEMCTCCLVELLARVLMREFIPFQTQETYIDNVNPSSANLAYIKGCWFHLDLFLVILYCSPRNLVIVRSSRILFSNFNTMHSTVHGWHENVHMLLVELLARVLTRVSTQHTSAKWIQAFANLA